MRAPRSLVMGQRSRRGVALVIVLCALFLLCVVIFGLAKRIDQEMYLSSRDNRSLEARALAFSGTQIALHPQVKAGTPALRRQIDRTHRYEARCVGEGGRLQLNWLLMGEDQTKLGVLKQYLENKGLNFQDREALVDCLLDFIEPGGKTHLNGSSIGADGQAVPRVGGAAVVWRGGGVGAGPGAADARGDRTVAGVAGDDAAGAGGARRGCGDAEAAAGHGVGRG